MKSTILTILKKRRTIYAASAALVFLIAVSFKTNATGCTEGEIAWNGCDACPESFSSTGGPGGGDCNCIFYTPIVGSFIHGQRFNVSTAENGVWFDMNADGRKHKTAWPVDTSTVAFLYMRMGNNYVEIDGETALPLTRTTHSSTPSIVFSEALAVSTTAFRNWPGMI